MPTAAASRVPSRLLDSATRIRIQTNINPNDPTSIGGKRTVFAEERHREILQKARENGRVDVASLAAELDVTPETVRRDLSLLERGGGVRRGHGGAIAIQRPRVGPAVAAPRAPPPPEK